MAKASRSSSPSATNEDGTPQAEAWTPPTSDQEFTFTTMDEAPAWVDRGWAGFSQGPALAVPAGDLFGNGPYHTKTARPGDKVIFTAGKAGMAPKLDVVTGVPDLTEGGVKKPPQESACSVEDGLKTGLIPVETLTEADKGAIALRSPGLKQALETGKGLAEKQNVSDIVNLE